MTLSYIDYDLQDGFIHNWLAAGPQVIPIHNNISELRPQEKPQVRDMFSIEGSGIKDLPVERGPVSEGVFKVGEWEGSWVYTSCAEDHFINHSDVDSGPRFQRSWVFTQVECPQSTEVQLQVTAYGNVNTWLNDAHTFFKDTFEEGKPGQAVFHATLKSGVNNLLFCFEDVTAGIGPHLLAVRLLQVDGLPLDRDSSSSQLKVRIPTLIIPRLIDLRNQMERLYAGSYLEHEIVQTHEDVTIHWPETRDAEAVITIRFISPEGMIFREGVVEGQPGGSHRMSSGYEYPAGRYKLLLLPRAWEYYQLHMRIRKEMEVCILGNDPATALPAESIQERWRKALTLATEQPDHLFAQTARMALGWWKQVDLDPVRAAAARVKQQAPGCLIDLAGLLHSLYRFGAEASFPEEYRQIAEDVVPGVQENWPPPSLANNRRTGLLDAACRLLAVQYRHKQVDPERDTDEDVLQKPQQDALQLMRSRAAFGLPAWDSSETIMNDLAALTLLLDFAEDETVREIATVLMDKTLFSLAVNAYQGILGTSGEACTWDAKGGLLQPTAGIQKLLWGSGVFNHRIEGTVILACSMNYELLDMIAAIATDLPDEMLNRESHKRNEGEAPINKITYRTPDYMLSSVQDYRPGEKGNREIAWQAVLGPGTTVFTNHPGCASQEDTLFPNYWIGNATLPRIAQWKNALVAIYNLPEDVWMDFTHAYFPTRAFDSYRLEGRWAFAQKGSAYLALAASQGLELVKQGQHAWRELRSPGLQNIWVCHLGRENSEGSFTRFQEKILQRKHDFTNDSVTFETLKGETLSFAWHGPFQCDGQEVPLGEYLHYDNPYTQVAYQADKMDIKWGDSILRLDFSL